ncbi:MAG: UvrB/UvrC motif-containing protein, partial [Bacteroidales bacterium]|nr:UvrB/UvrC motif-containing protein [Bacteroidales bacterium]
GGDRSRKDILVEYGFRLPAAADNRPLKFDEFEGLIGQRVFVSATPGDYELAKSDGVIVEQIVRPTGLLDPPIEVRPSKNQIDDLLEEIEIRAEKDERVLVTTLTKRMAEELEKFLIKRSVRARYIHSDVDTLERVEIIEDFKAGRFDVLVGVNLLREGLDLPDVSLVAIIDADKEGFLRSDRALTQTAGRAARNLNGLVIMYADTITGSMKRTIDETNRRRAIQQQYNKDHNIVPSAVKNDRKNSLARNLSDGYSEPERSTGEYLAEDPVLSKMSEKQLLQAIEAAKKRMEEAAKELDFPRAAKFRDEMYELMKLKK